VAVLATAEDPTVKDAGWPRDDIDRFILASFGIAQLAPVADVDPVTLVRRMSFDLTGLPPTLQELDDFCGRINRLTKRLVWLIVWLASPDYGVHWGRHWLDLARFGESTGFIPNLRCLTPGGYRDYVIRSFNQDKPYHAFIREQIAGDLCLRQMPTERDEQLIATGFMAIGVKMSTSGSKFATSWTMSMNRSTLSRALYWH